MGIHNLWKIIEPCQKEFTLEQLASDQFNKKNGNGLRVAIDVALWIFQARTTITESSVEGDQIQLRTIFFRLCRLYELGIRAVFVFDGPNRPAYKRNKLVNTLPTSDLFQTSLLSIIRHFNFSIWNAYGDAEAECAVLQRLDIVDLVVTGDSDVFLFGARRVMRQWPNKKNETVQCYDLSWIEEATELDRSDLILIALLRGSDYDSRGTHGIGIQLATGLAKCHYHRELFDNVQSDGCLDKEKVNTLYDYLTYELHHNTQAKLQRKYTSIQLDPSFPDFFVIKDFIHPKTNIASVDYINQARELIDNLNSYHDPDWPKLAYFVQHAFKWPSDYVVKRISLLLFPGYMSNILRLRKSNNKHSGKKDKQTRLEDYYRFTSNYRPPIDNGVIEKISGNKTISETVQLYRVKWQKSQLENFQDIIKSQLTKGAYNDIIPCNEKDQMSNVWINVQRHWVDAKLIHNVYPSFALEYQKSRKSIGTFLVKPQRK